MSFNTGRNWLAGFDTSGSDRLAGTLAAGAMQSRAQGAKEIASFWEDATGGLADASKGINAGMGAFGAGALQARVANELGEKDLDLRERLGKKAIQGQGGGKSGGGIFGSIGGLAGTIGKAAGVFGPAGPVIGAGIGALADFL